MREIVFDTETTGLRPEDGERIIEIGAVELENGFPTGRTFHAYVNPEGRTVHPDALAIHGIEDDFLSGQKPFSQIAPSFLEFVAGANLVAHNAAFDMAFINAELSRLEIAPIPAERVVDTLAIARRRHPMGPNSLDALCSRYGIDNSHREKHGALLDSELLAEVYIEMNGGRQAALVLENEQVGEDQPDRQRNSDPSRMRPVPLPPRLTPAEAARHREFVAGLGENPLWFEYQSADQG